MKFNFSVFLFEFFYLLTFIKNIENDSSTKILMKGWLKFFAYVQTFNLNEKPHYFDINSAFFSQYSNNNSINNQQTDQFGSIEIPSKNHFFFVLTKESLFVISARRNDIAKTYKSLEIKWILPISKDSKLKKITINKCKYKENNGIIKGGIEDLGNFREGFCFRLRAKTKIIWNLCSDSNLEKEKWISSFIEILPEESEYEQNGSLDSVILPYGLNMTFGISSTDSSEKNNNFTTPQDGKWVLLQDWSQCSLACGGGKQFLQRICIPQRNGGNPCFGDEVLERECNTFECPNFIKQEYMSQETMAPIIKLQRISNRPQRYEVCIVKEEDMDLLIDLKQFEKGARLPVRVVLNNKTLTIFASQNYNSIYKSFDLQYLILKQHPKENKACFIVIDKRDIQKRVSLCILPTNIGYSQTILQLRDKWVYDINFFKEKCSDKIKIIDNQGNIQKKRAELEIEVRNEKIEKIMERREEMKEKIIEQEVEETAKLALEVVGKELKYEQLAIKEEIMREREQENQLELQVENEKQKEECIERKLIQKERQKEIQNRHLELQNKAQQIKRQAYIQMQQARLKTKQKIEQMRRAAERRRKESKRKILEIRTKIAAKLLSESRSGNISNCNPQQTEQERNKYCNANMKDDYQKLNDCKRDSGDFCYTCCENEFGRIHEELRDKCYLKCDEYSDYEGKLSWKLLIERN